LIDGAGSANRANAFAMDLQKADNANSFSWWQVNCFAANDRRKPEV